MTDRNTFEQTVRLLDTECALHAPDPHDGSFGVTYVHPDGDARTMWTDNWSRTFSSSTGWHDTGLPAHGSSPQANAAALLN